MLNTLKESLQRASFKKVLENIENDLSSPMQDAGETELKQEPVSAAEVQELIDKIPCNDSGDDPVDIQGLIDELPVIARI